MDANIWAYMASHGTDLKKSGSAERGFSKSEILDLLKLLQERNFKPLGLEVWRPRGDERFEMDVLAGWVPTTLADVPALLAEVRKIVESTKMSEQAIFTLQF